MLTIGLVLQFVALVTAVPLDLKLSENGYEGLVVSVSEDIPQEQCRRIVTGLKVSHQTLLLLGYFTENTKGK